MSSARLHNWWLASVMLNPLLGKRLVRCKYLLDTCALRWSNNRKTKSHVHLVELLKMLQIYIYTSAIHWAICLTASGYLGRKRGSLITNPLNSSCFPTILHCICETEKIYKCMYQQCMQKFVMLRALGSVIKNAKNMINLGSRSMLPEKF